MSFRGKNVLRTTIPREAAKLQPLAVVIRDGVQAAWPDHRSVHLLPSNARLVIWEPITRGYSRLVSQIKKNGQKLPIFRLFTLTRTDETTHAASFRVTNESADKI